DAAPAAKPAQGNLAEAAPAAKPAQSNHAEAAPVAKPAQGDLAEAPVGNQGGDLQASVGPTGRVKASPYVRKLAREQGFDLHSVAGSGPGGRIVARDVTGALAAAPPKPAAAPVVAAPGALAEPEARPLSMMRKAIARRLTESKQTVPHF